MSTNLFEVENDVVTQTADIGRSEPLLFEFRLSFYTPATGAKIRAAEDAMAAQIEVMADAITSWDVVETLKDDKGRTILGDDGRPTIVPVPVSVAAIRRFSVRQINAIYRAMEDLAFPPETKDAS